MKSLLPLLMAISKEKLNLDISAIDNELIDFSISAGIAPYLKYCSQESDKTPNKDISTKLVSSELSAKFITRSMYNSLRLVLNHLQKDTEGIVLLKGIAVGKSYYPRDWLRLMGDIDLLVHSSDIPKIKTTLFKLGYKQISHNPAEFYESHHHLMPFYNARLDTWIEVHTNLLTDASLAKNDTLFNIDNIYSNTIPASEQISYEKQLSTDMQLIYTCVHWAEDYSSYKGCLQLIDIIHLVKCINDKSDWPSLSEKLKATKSASIVYLAISYLIKHNIIEINSIQFEKDLKKNNISILNRYILFTIIDTYFIKGKCYGSIFSENNVKIIWKTLIQPRNSFINLLNIPWNILFPPDNKQRFSFELLIIRIKQVLKNK